MPEFKNTGTWRYIKLTLWSIEAISIFIILCVELYVYYGSLKYKENKSNLEMETNHSATSPKSNSKLNTHTSTDHPSSQDRVIITTNVSTTNVSKSKRKRKKKAYHLTNILPIISYIFYALVGSLTILDIANMFSCYVGGMLPLTSYIMGKSFMYLLFIYRLHIIYAKSVFKYNQWILVALFISIILYGVGNTIANAFTLEASSVDINGTRFCGITITFPVLAVGAVYDLSITAICCILFIRPLRTLTKMNKEANYKITKLVYKYTILTFVSVTTTFLIYIIIGITDLEAIGSIDIIINCLCMMMFNSYYHQMYKILCCCPINISNRMSCCNKNEDSSET